MDYRKKTFTEKFKSASQFLNCDVNDIISIKLRGTFNSNDYYKRFAQLLKRDNNFPLQTLDGNFQGNAFLVSVYQNKIIYVEHETGLEILYIAGSIASLIGLIPAIIKIWSYVRNNNDRYGRDSFERIETRYFDKTGKLVEEHNSSFYDDNFSNLSLLSFMNQAIDNNDLSKNNYENEIEDLKKRVENLEQKVGKLLKGNKNKPKNN